GWRRGGRGDVARAGNDLVPVADPLQGTRGVLQREHLGVEVLVVRDPGVDQVLLGLQVGLGLAVDSHEGVDDRGGVDPGAQSGDGGDRVVRGRANRAGTARVYGHDALLPLSGTCSGTGGPRRSARPTGPVRRVPLTGSA